MSFGPELTHERTQQSLVVARAVVRDAATGANTASSIKKKRVHWKFALSLFFSPDTTPSPANQAPVGGRNRAASYTRPSMSRYWAGARVRGWGRVKGVAVKEVDTAGGPAGPVFLMGEKSAGRERCGARRAGVQNEACVDGADSVLRRCCTWGDDDPHRV